MKDKIISLEIAESAYKKGFSDKHCRHCYRNYYAEKYFEGVPEEERGYTLQVYHRGIYNGENPLYLAPTQRSLQMWLIDEYNFVVYIVPIENDDENIEYESHIYMPGAVVLGNYEKFYTYEDALEKGLLETLKLLEDTIHGTN